MDGKRHSQARETESPAVNQRYVERLHPIIEHANGNGIDEELLPESDDEDGINVLSLSLPIRIRNRKCH